MKEGEGRTIMKRKSMVTVIGFMLVLVWAGPGPATAEKSASLSPRHLRCEYREDPLGIDETRPRLSWQLESPERGQRQSAYRILAASSEAGLEKNLGDLWDSGRIGGDETVQIVYRGQPLTSRMLCFWKVMVWDEQGRPSAWSRPASFRMGLLEEGDWKARWIGYDLPGQRQGRAPKVTLPSIGEVVWPFSKHYSPCPYLRKTFTVSKPVRRATVSATALGLYELHLNGARVGQDYFTPGWTDYNQRVYYQTYDVTDLIRPGADNVLGAILADGWYAGNVGWLGQRIYGWQLRLRAELYLEYEDGTSEVVATDGSWRAAAGPIREADIQAGESYDARLEMPGWDQAGFDDANWKPVTLTERVAAKVEAYPGLPVRRTGELKPIERTQPKPGVWVFNLGQNFSGRARLQVIGKPGDKVVLRFAERLNPDGTIYTRNLRTARATDTYILKGGGQETWEPRFTYHGFQYVELTGYPGAPAADAVTGIVLHSDLPLTSSLETSNELVNKLYRNVVWGQRSNYFEVPTDCPQRDERLGWTGDAQAFIRTAAYNMDIAAFFTKWLQDLEDGQFENGAFPRVAPHVAPGIAAGWGDAGIICPWTIWRVYGDTRIIEKHYAAMARWIEFLEKRSPNYLSPPLGNEGDWLNVNAITPKDLIATAYFGEDARLMAEMAQAIGKGDDAAKYRRLFANIQHAFTAQFVSADGKIAGDTQTAYLMALQFDLLPPELRPAAARHLVENLQARDGLLSTGFLGAHLLLPALTDAGRTDAAYRLLTETRYPSWGYEITQGATTTWERWNSYTAEHGFENPMMNSFNHYAFGAVGEWMFATLAGIDTDGPGFTRLLIHPRPGGGLTSAQASYDSIRGKIETRWRLEGDDLRLEVTIPANTTAFVYVPAAKAEDVSESGRPAAESPGVRFLRLEDGSAVFEVGSGNYAFVSKWKADKRL